MGLVRRGILWGLRVPGTTQADWNLWQGKSERISRYQAGVAHLLTWNMQCHPIMNFPTLTYLLWQGKKQLIKPCLPLPLPCNLRILEYLSRSPSYFLWGNVYHFVSKAWAESMWHSTSLTSLQAYTYLCTLISDKVVCLVTCFRGTSIFCLSCYSPQKWEKPQLLCLTKLPVLSTVFDSSSSEF